jgi:hypothetical protein
MNYLALVGRLRRKCRIAGGNPTSLANQSEEINRLADWINEAWMEIQLIKGDWEWMRGTFSFPTVNGKLTYTATEAGIPAGTFANWRRDTLRNHNTATGTTSEIIMSYRTYDEWRNMYNFGANRNVFTRPTEYAFTPDKQLAMGPIAAAGYTVTGEYFTVAKELTAESEEPSMPSQFHMAIVYKAMMFYGASEAAAEVYQEGENQFNLFKNMLVLDRLPEIRMPGALA